LIQFNSVNSACIGNHHVGSGKINTHSTMDYVYKYLQPYTGKLNSYFDVYLVIFFLQQHRAHK
jgi:hypothetical protein